MRILKRLDMRRLSISIARNGGETLGYGLLVGTVLIGFVRMGRKMRPVRRKHGR